MDDRLTQFPLQDPASGPVATTVPHEDLYDDGREVVEFPLTNTGFPCEPVVVRRATHLENVADCSRGKASVLNDGLDGGVHVAHTLRPKMVSAFLSTSRSRVTRSNSASSCFTRSSSFEATGPACSSCRAFHLYRRVDAESFGHAGRRVPIKDHLDRLAAQLVCERSSSRDRRWRALFSRHRRTPLAMTIFSSWAVRQIVSTSHCRAGGCSQVADQVRLTVTLLSPKSDG